MYHSRSLVASSILLCLGIWAGPAPGAAEAETPSAAFELPDLPAAEAAGHAEGLLLDPLDSRVLLANQSPVACFNVSTSSGQAPLTVTFNSSCSYDPDGYIFSRIWTFGDGAYGGDVVTVTHTYSTPGSYTSSLTVNDNNGWLSQAYRVITVAPPPPPAPSVAPVSVATAHSCVADCFSSEGRSSRVDLSQLTEVLTAQR